MGKRANLLYTGDEAPFKNSEPKVDVMADHNSNGGIYIHTVYQEPPGAEPAERFTRELAEATFALQCHDPESVVRYKNIRVMRLADRAPCFRFPTRRNMPK